MRTPIIAGNWKMNYTPDEAVAFIEEIKARLDQIDGVDKVVCPPFMSIAPVARALKGTDIGIGAQNMFFEAKGAYTGEVAPNMLTPYCQYVILGHSERRALFGESDDFVNRKVQEALKHQLTPIICVGESLEQNEADETYDVVSRQVEAALNTLEAEDVAQCIIAYEPIWAIGTGKSATVEVAGNTIKKCVRDTIRNLYGDETAESIRIQYGGSVKEHNIADYMAHPDIDGALVGGASLKPGFVDLVRNATS